MPDIDNQATEDVGPSKEAETVVTDDTSLEEDDLKFEDLDFDESEDDEPASKSSDEEQSEETNEESEEESQDDTDDTKEAEVEDTDTEAERKRFNAEMARQRIAEKKAKEEARQAQEALQAERLQNYLSEAEDDADEYDRRAKEIETLRLQQERASINAERLQLGVEKALVNIDLFRTGSEVVKNQLLNALDEFEATMVVKDQQGNPVEVKGDVYQYLVKRANEIRELTQAGAVQEAKTKEQAKARVITPPSRTPKAPKVDKDLEDFDRMWS